MPTQASHQLDNGIMRDQITVPKKIVDLEISIRFEVLYFTTLWGGESGSDTTRRPSDPLTHRGGGSGCLLMVSDLDSAPHNVVKYIFSHFCVKSSILIGLQQVDLSWDPRPEQVGLRFLRTKWDKQSHWLRDCYWPIRLVVSYYL